jgi:hypothetical protein
MRQLSEQNADAAAAQDYKLNLLAQVDSAIGVAANFAQLLSVALLAGSVTERYGFLVILAISP